MKQSLANDPAALGRILESIPEFVTLVDVDGVIRYLNRAELGRSPDELLGMPAASLVSPGTEETFRSALQSVLATGESQEYDIEVVAKEDGPTAWYRCRMVAYWQHGSMTGALIVATNISELKAAQDYIEQLRQILPICSWCDRIRNSEGSWETISEYIGRTTATPVSHVICADCYQREYPGGKPVPDGGATRP